MDAEKRKEQLKNFAEAISILKEDTKKWEEIIAAYRKDKRDGLADFFQNDLDRTRVAINILNDKIEQWESENDPR